MGVRLRTRKAVTGLLSVLAASALGLLGLQTPASAMAGGQPLDWQTQAGGMVSVINDDPHSGGICSGSLISTNPSARSTRLVLTAWHCLTDPAGQLVTTPDELRVYNGGNQPGQGTLYGVSQFMRVTIGNQLTDSVVFQLTQFVNGSLPFPYDTNTHYGNGTQVRADGYGITDPSENMSLRQGNFTIINETPATYFNVQGQGALTCAGDSGGPVINQNGVIIGTVWTGAADPAQCSLAWVDVFTPKVSKLEASDLNAIVTALQ
ncbi:trypsin-like serine protease [Streptomyces sp. NPDC048290]|uniref:trypsin-like serine protease n=1 Tax=Streptomyces sp. NPDC048290 TaxID=3155811 RepID=UPI00344869E1